jgi:hypothetical protein
MTTPDRNLILERVAEGSPPLEKTVGSSPTARTVGINPAAR